MKKLASLLITALMLVAIMVPIAAAAPTKTIPEIVAEKVSTDGEFTVLAAALDKANLLGTLGGVGPFTVFAPTDAAFADLLATLDITAAQLLAQPQLADVLLYHVLSGKIMSGDLVDADTPETLNGDDVTIDLDGGAKINDANVTAADFEATNGVIHVIDKVLVPAGFTLTGSIVDIASSNSNFSTLVAALQTADLVDTLEGDGPFTVFAPTNAAFADLLAALDITAAQLLAQPDLAKVLLYHVVSGKIMSGDLVDGDKPATVNGEKVMVDLDGGVKINDAKVTTPDILANNGVIHVIDKVLVPTNFTLTGSIVDIASANSDFSTLVAALQAADLVDTLEGDGPFTVFAPTNAAFADLLAALGITAEDLLAQPDLAKVLLYHVVSGKIMSGGLVDGATPATVNGETVMVDLDGGVKINDAKVTTPDILANNGVIHVIDKVLVPTNFALTGSIVDIALGNNDFSTLVAALQAADLVDTLEGDGPFTVFAPTNAAFADLLAALGITAEELLAHPDLSKVLLYHVIPGKVMSKDLVDGATPATVNGETVMVDLGDGVFINKSKVTMPDIEATNGVIHIIDKVLVPTNFVLVDINSLPEIPDTGDKGDQYILISSALFTLGAVIATLGISRRRKAVEITER